MTDEKIVKVCGHCGNLTTFDKRAEYEYNLYDERSNEAAYTTWRILQCPACLKPVFQEIFFYTGDSYDEPTDQILYPSAKTTPIELLDLPIDIRKEYEETLKVQPISTVACAVLARRTLEAICAHENAAGKTLEIQVASLLKSDRIPPVLGDMAHLGRKIGNLGAHVANEQVSKDHIIAMLDFLKTILEYLYIAPAKVAEAEAILNKTYPPAF